MFGGFRVFLVITKVSFVSILVISEVSNVFLRF